MGTLNTLLNSQGIPVSMQEYLIDTIKNKSNSTYILAKLKNKRGKVVGARVQFINEVRTVTIKQLLELTSKGVEFCNARVCSNGYIRAKSGTFPVETLDW